jgi:hypothetical protein
VKDFIANKAELGGIVAGVNNPRVVLLVQTIVERLLEQSAEMLQAQEYKNATEVDVASARVITAPMFFVHALTMAIGNSERMQSVLRTAVRGLAQGRAAEAAGQVFGMPSTAAVQAAVDAVPDRPDATAALETVDALGVYYLCEALRSSADLQPALNWTDFAIRINTNYDDIPQPSPLVATRATIQTMLDPNFKLLYADPGQGYLLPLATDDEPRNEAEFVNTFDRAKPSHYPYPGGVPNDDDAGFAQAVDGSARPAASDLGGSREFGMFGDLFGQTQVTTQRATAFQTAGRAAIVRDGAFGSRSVHHAQWFLNPLRWSNSPSFINNWNRVLGEVDAARKCSMLTFLFTHICMDSCRKLQRAKHVVLPYGFLGVRLNWTHRMGGYLLTKSGKETGFTAFGNPIYMMEENTTLQTFEAHYTAYMKAIVQRPQNVCKWDNAFFEEYLGGGGHKPCSLAFIERWATQHRFFPPAFQRGVPCLHFLMISYAEREHEMIIDITGSFSDPHLASRPITNNVSELREMHYDSAHFYQVRHRYQSYGKPRYGWLNYFDGPVANRYAVLGYSRRCSETGVFDVIQENLGHLGPCGIRHPKTHLIRGGRTIQEPDGHPITVLA